MNFGDNIHEWMSSYLNNEMSEGERSEFENRLQTDQEFAKTFEAHKISHQIVVGHELVKLKAQMSKDLSGNKFSGSKNTWKYITGGVVVVSTLLIIYFLLKNVEDKTSIQENTPVQKGKEFSAPKGETPVEDSVLLKNEPEENIHTPSPDALPKPDEKKKMCVDTLISFSCQARAACENQDNGAIEVDVNTIKSGKAPFEFSITPDGSFVDEGIIKDLKPGKYSLYVKDAGNCIRKLNVKVEVPEINCGHLQK